MWNVTDRFTKQQISRTLAVGALAALLASASVAVLVGGQEAGGEEGHPQGADPGVIDAARTMLASTPVPESQREALADGVVTYVEYEAAVFSTIACIEAAGLKILEQPHPDPSGKVLEYSFAAGMDLAEAERSSAIHRECYVEHLAAINILWSAQNTPSQEIFAEARRSLVECLSEALPGAITPGAQVPDWVWGSEAFLPCLEDIQKEYGLPGFGG
ncbi:MAG: hypothetical protein WD557_10830 [Dehalococcoidia bacterium]